MLFSVAIVSLFLTNRISVVLGGDYTPLDAILELINSADYDKNAHPARDKEYPVNVTIDLHISAVGKISPEDMDFKLTFYLRQSWRDSRLSYGWMEEKDSYTLAAGSLESIWTPDTYISNLKSGNLHDVTMPNKFLRIHPDGKILYSQKLTTTLHCNMYLKKYPMDEQKCFIHFASYGYTEKYIVMGWTHADQPVTFAANLSHPDFNIVHVSTYHQIDAYSTGNYSQLVVEFHIERRLNVFLLSVYAPSGLLVVLSWMSFWIDLESVSARISLSIITILTLTTQTFSCNAGLFTTSVVKALDVWMSVCLFFVFAAFLEYIVIHSMSKSSTNNDIKRPSIIVDDIHIDINNLSEHGQSPNNPTKNMIVTSGGIHYNGRTNIAMKIDKTSRALFPALFLVFNVLYWLMYLNMSPHSH